MLRSYIKIAWRNIRKNGFHSFINVFGLSIGLAFTLLIAAYVWSELRVNKDLKNADRQYIILSKWKDPNMGYEIGTLAPLARTLKEQYPSLIANYYRFDGITSNVSKGENAFREGIQIGDSSLLNMYGFNLIYGDKRTALNEPFSVVLTENRALKYFGKTDVVGETLMIESFSGTKHDFRITGVMKNPSENSVTHLNSDSDNQFYLPLSACDFFGRPIKTWNDAYVVVAFVELQPKVTVKDLEKPLQDLLHRNVSPQIAANLTPHLVPLKKYYLEKDNGLVSKMLWTVSLIALFILIMAIVNFINVTISKSSGRIREVGVRKVLGGMRKQLILQFLSESIILVLFATVFAFIVYSLANPLLSAILGKEIPKFSTLPFLFFACSVVAILLLGCLAGFYPALILSTLKTVDSLKGKLKSVKENVMLRKSLVGLQFFTASLVFIGAIIVAKQISFFFSKELGYNKEYVVSAQVPRDWTEKGLQHMKSVRDEFAMMPEVTNVSLSWQTPNGWDAGKFPVFAHGKDSSQAISTQSIITDEEYVETFKIPMKAGRFFKDEADSLNIVLNETAIKMLGWKNTGEAIGKQVFFAGNNPITIIGVASDFHFGSMKEKIQPITFIHTDLWNMYRFLSFKLRPGNVHASLAALQKKWSVLFPGAAFEYSFMDDTLGKLYQAEIKLKKATQTATILALIIVLLGVISLVSISIQKRTKEIGIRKVLGATVSSIISLFLREFLPVLLIAGGISVPVALYLMTNWLNDYAYRINLTAQPFLLPLLILGMITTLIITIQILKAASDNPVKSIRIE
jgi:ABC-type antimicrobial peptide transport system permease subunit